MVIVRILLSLFLPPLAVVDKGCVVLLVVTFLTIAGWFPGVIAALLVVAIEQDRNRQPRYVTVGAPTKQKIVPAYLETEDGTPLEVIDPDADDRDDWRWLAR